MKNMMKFKYVFSFAPVLAAFAFITIWNQESVVQQQDLPAKARDYISTHFPGQSVAKVEQEKNIFSTSFEALLADSTELEFTKEGAINSVEAPGKLPDSVVPAKILDYVNANYGGFDVNGWEVEKKHQEIDLANGTELEFDLDGNFVRVEE